MLTTSSAHVPHFCDCRSSTTPHEMVQDYHLGGLDLAVPQDLGDKTPNEGLPLVCREVQLCLLVAMAHGKNGGAVRGGSLQRVCAGLDWEGHHQGPSVTIAPPVIQTVPRIPPLATGSSCAICTRLIPTYEGVAVKACSLTGARAPEQGPSTLGAPRDNTDMGGTAKVPPTRRISAQCESLVRPPRLVDVGHSTQDRSRAKKDSTAFPRFLLPRATADQKPPMHRPSPPKSRFISSVLLAQDASMARC